ncbi:MAG TPA: hypothetical protein VF273_00180 [Pelobium sp.]
MTKINILTFAVIALFVLNMATIGFLVFTNPAIHSNNNEGPKNIIIKKLHFNEAQTEQYQLLIDEHQEQMRALRNQLKETKQELYSTLNHQNLVLSDSLISKIALINTEIEKLNYHHFEQIKKLCKPDQQKYFATLTAELSSLFSPDKNPPPHQ